MSKSKLLLTSTLLIASALLVGCVNKQSDADLNMNQDQNDLMILSDDEKQEIFNNMQEPLTNSSELSDLETELNNTIILEEDFSDLEQ